MNLTNLHSEASDLSTATTKNLYSRRWFIREIVTRRSGSLVLLPPSAAILAPSLKAEQK